MNARQAAKHYKQKYKELSNILSVTKVQPHITYTQPTLTEIKATIQIPDQNNFANKFNYEHHLYNAKEFLIQRIQDNIIPYIQIERQFEYIPSPDFNAYIAKIDILDRRNY